MTETNYAHDEVLKNGMDSHRHVRDMDINKIALARVMSKLSQCLNEGHTLNIADRTTLVGDQSLQRRKGRCPSKRRAISWHVGTYQFDLKRLCQCIDFLAVFVHKTYQYTHLAPLLNHLQGPWPRVRSNPGLHR